MDTVTGITQYDVTTPKKTALSVAHFSITSRATEPHYSVTTTVQCRVTDAVSSAAHDQTIKDKKKLKQQKLKNSKSLLCHDVISRLRRNRHWILSVERRIDTMERLKTNKFRFFYVYLFRSNSPRMLHKQTASIIVIINSV